MNETPQDVAGGLAPLRFHALAGGLTPFRYEEVAGSATGGLTEIAGWTLVHFLWQGLIIALLAAAGLACLRRFSAATRYLFACGGLALMLAAPLVTAMWMLNGAEGLKLPATTGESSPAPLVPEALAIQPLVSEPSGPPAAELPTVTPPTPELVQTGSDRKTDWLGALQGSLPVIVGVWCAGVVLLSLRLLAGLWRVWQWRGTGVPVQAESLKQMAARLALRMGVRQPFELLESARTHVPAVIGWMRPVVMVPASLVTGLTPAELESLLAHELAHIRRHDYLVNLLQTVVETVLFYHPAVWWLSAVIRTEREHCCDDLAVAACGNRVVFARALARMEELRCGQPGLALSARGGSLLGRIQRIVLPQATRPVVWWPAGMASLASLAVVAVGLWTTMENEPVNMASPDADISSSVEGAAETAAGNAPADDDPFATHREESEVIDGKTGQTHHVLAGVKMTSAEGKSSVADLKYSSLMQYTFIPERVARELKSADLGEIDFGDKPQPGQGQPLQIQLSSLVPPPPAAEPWQLPAEGDLKGKPEFVTVDELAEPAGTRTIAPYPDPHIFVPDHLAFYGVNRTGQRKFRVVRIEKVDLGLGPSFGPVNALVLDDANSDIGVLGSNWARIPRGPKGESFVHAAVDGFWFMALPEELKPKPDEEPLSVIWRLKHVSAEAMERVIRERLSVSPAPTHPRPIAGEPSAGSQLRVVADHHSNSLVIVGTIEQRESVLALLKELDVSSQAAAPSAADNEKVLATHTYDQSRRESTGWVEVNGVSLPVDGGPEAAGVKVCVTLMMDVVAIETASGKVLWHHNWNKQGPVWQKATILETGPGDSDPKQVVVEFETADGRTKERFDLRTGAAVPEPEPSEAQPADIRVIKRDGDQITLAAMESQRSGRSPVELLRRHADVLMRQGMPVQGAWVTDQETLVSAHSAAMWGVGPNAPNAALDAMQVHFNLPEGSGMRAEFVGEKVEITAAAFRTSVVVTNGRVKLFDSDGVERAIASPNGGAELLVVDVRSVNGEGVLEMQTRRLKPDPEYPQPPVQVKCNLATGEPADEEQPPHGAVRFAFENPNASEPARMKIRWHYDMQRLIEESERESGQSQESLLNTGQALHQTAAEQDHDGNQPLSLPAEMPHQTLEQSGSDEGQVFHAIRVNGVTHGLSRESLENLVRKPASELTSFETGILTEVTRLQGEGKFLWLGKVGSGLSEPAHEWGAVAENSGLQSRLVCQTKQPTVGQPLLFSLELRNAGDKPAEYDPQDYAPFRVLRAERDDGKPAPFIGMTPQTSGQPVTLQPGEATVLWKDVDATELFVLMKGKHEFLAEGGEWAAQTLWRDSNTVTVELQPGQLPPRQSLVWGLTELELRPEGWNVSAGHGAIFLSHSTTNLKRDVTTIQLWFTDEPLPADFQLGEGQDRQDVTTIAPCELGHLHVAAPPRAKELWPEYVRDIRIAAARALNFNAQPEVSPPDAHDGSDSASGGALTEDGWGPFAGNSGLRVRLTLAESDVKEGEPVLATLEVQNTLSTPVQYTPWEFEVCSVIGVVDERGILPTGFIVPVFAEDSPSVTIGPQQSAVLWENVNLAEHFMLEEGTYTVFAVPERDALHRGITHVQTGGAAPQSFRLEVGKGQLPLWQRLVKQLLGIRPDEWGIGVGRGKRFGFISPTSMPDRPDLSIWLSATEEPLKDGIRPGNDGVVFSVTTIGKCELGYLHVSGHPETIELWPDYLDDIREVTESVVALESVPVESGDKAGAASIEGEEVSTNDLPWQATGRVTDREGKPLAGVGVQAHCGFGTLFRTGQAVTDEEGRYDLRFGPGLHSENRQLVQAATISVSLAGHVEQNLHRQGDLVAALEKPEGDDLGWGGKTADDLFLPGQPKTIDFVMVPATKLSGVVMGKDGDRLDGVRVSLTGPDLPPSSSVVATTRTDKGGRFELTDLPTGFAYQLLIEPAKAESPWLGWASPPLTLAIDEQGNNCFTTEHDGRKQFWTIQELFIQLDGEGVNWKEALADSANRPVEMKFDGISTESQRIIGEQVVTDEQRRISAGMATIVLGSGQE